MSENSDSIPSSPEEDLKVLGSYGSDVGSNLLPSNYEEILISLRKEHALWQQVILFVWLILYFEKKRWVINTFIMNHWNLSLINLVQKEARFFTYNSILYKTLNATKIFEKKKLKEMDNNTLGNNIWENKNVGKVNIFSKQIL